MPPEKPLRTSRNKHDLANLKKHKTMIDWTCQVVVLLRRWIGPSKEISISVDNAFATYALANKCIDCNVKLISRMRMDARTFEFPSRKQGKGRKPLVGKRLPTFKTMLEDPTTIWTTITVVWYGGINKKMEFLTGSCLWYGYGIRPVPIRWVLTREENNNATATVLFSTDIEMTVGNIIEDFVCRWQIEVTFKEARRHLGMETQRQWSDNSIVKMTPCLLASYSIINLIALEDVLTKKENIPIQTSSWYKKQHVTFSDVLAYLRRKILRKKYFLQFGKNLDLWEFGLEEIIEEMSAA